MMGVGVAPDASASAASVTTAEASIDASESRPAGAAHSAQSTVQSATPVQGEQAASSAPSATPSDATPACTVPGAEAGIAIEPQDSPASPS